MKLNYQTPYVNVIRIMNEDILTTSNNTDNILDDTFDSILSFN